MLRKGGERLRVVFGEKEMSQRLEKGMKEENADAAQETELKTDLGADERIEGDLDEERSSKEVEPARMAADQFADEIEHRGQPTSLYRRNGPHKKKVDIDGEE